MGYLFVLGKNRKLSIDEVVAYFESRGYNVNVNNGYKEIALVQLDRKIHAEKVISDLGGTIKICGVVSELGYEINVDLDKWFPSFGSKLRFGVSVYSEKGKVKLWKRVTEKIKKAAKNSRIKMIHVTPREGHALRHIEVLDKLSKRDGYEIVIYNNGEKVYVARTVAVHNPHEFMKRDTGRPAQRTIFSIPPRLAKILINLSRAKAGDTLLDPFCGIGTIPQEAVLMGMSVVSMDKNPKCVKGWRTNFAWLKREYGLKNANVKIINDDVANLSKHIKKESIDAIATEPYLGPPLKDTPTKKEACRILSELTALYSNALEEFHKVLKESKHISIVSPNFKTKEGEELNIDMEKLASRRGFKIICGPILDADKRHLTRREVYVLQKAKE